MKMPDLQKIYEEFMVYVIPIFIVIVVVGMLWAVVDLATPKDWLSEFMGGPGILKFFTNLPSDGLKVLVIGALIEAGFVIVTVVAITAKQGRRFWYKILFRKEPP